MTVLHDTRPAPSALGQTWSIEPARSAVEVRMLRTPWRARLRVLGGRLTSAADGSDVRLSAVLSSRAQLATLPATRGWFLHDVARTQRLLLIAHGTATSSEDGLEIDTHAKAWAGQREWAMPMRIVLRHFGDGIGVVELSTHATCRQYSALFGRPLRIDAAAEVTRCG